MSKQEKKYKLKCKYCGLEFEAIRSNIKYCSQNCAVKFWKSNNKDRIKKLYIEYKLNNSEQYKQMKKKSQIKWYSNNPNYRNDYNKHYRKKRYYNDPQYRLQCLYRVKFNNALMKNHIPKNPETKMLFNGQTPKYYQDYIKSKFLPDMTWKNRGLGQGKWNIDHIIPIKAFDLRDPEQVKACWHWTNLQCLWHPDNIRKGCKIA